MKIGVIGTGYVGIVTGSCLAQIGHQVVCFDVDEKKIHTYSKGQSAIYEPGLAEIIQENLKKNNLSFTTDINEMILHSEIIFICVGTPPLPDGSADLSQVETAVRAVAENAPAQVYKIIVEKSTVPVGTHKRLKNIMKLYNKGKSHFDFVVNSEFLREGSAVEDFMKPDRIVIGVETEESKKSMLKLYESFHAEKVIVDPSTAEIIKYAANSFLAMKISFINLIADLCEKTGGDVAKVADGIGMDHRIGRAFLNAGIGYGGSCFPKDVKAMIQILDENTVDGTILKSIDEFNAKRYRKVLQTLEEELWILKNKDIAIWGLAFKPDTDDVREAPSLKIVKELLDKEVNLRLYDSEAAENFKKFFPENGKVKYFDSPMEAIKGVEALIVLTEWKEFSKIQPKEIYNLMKVPCVFDGRNVFNPEDMKAIGFRYFPIGKGKVLENNKNSK